MKEHTALKIDTEILDTHEVKLRVEADPQELEDAKQRAARRIAKQTKVPGFRPGKAPYHIIERHVGPAAILEEAIQILVEDIYPKALDQAEIKPYGPGRLEEMPSTDPPVFEFMVPLEAEVTLGEYNEMRLDYDLQEVSDEDVMRVINNIRQNQAVIEPVERAVEEGDMVQILLSGERSEVEEGESAVVVQERSVPIVVEPEDADTSVEWPFPGFSRTLVGTEPGESKEVRYTFPEDAPFEAMRGKEVVYQFTVENVKSRTLPEINDELAVSMGEYENLEALRSEIRERLAEQSESEYNQTYDDDVIDHMVEQATIKYPPQMLEDERQAVLRQFESRLSQQNMDLDTYLKTRKVNREDFIEELTPVAEQRLKRFLILFKLAGVEEIQVRPEEVQQEAIRTIEYLTRSMSQKEAKKTITSDLVNNLAGNITTDLLLTKSMNRLRRIARGLGDVPEEPEVDEAQIEAEIEAELAAQERIAAESELAAGEPVESEAEPETEEPAEVEADDSQAAEAVEETKTDEVE